MITPPKLEILKHIPLGNSVVAYTQAALKRNLTGESLLSVSSLGSEDALQQ